MKYIELKAELKNFLVFSVHDIRKIDPSFHLQRLSEWQKKGYIRKVINGYYVSSDTRIDEQALFLIANSLVQPSYVSLEMALAYYGLIPESVYGITSVSSRSTRSFATDMGSFTYRKIKSELLFGYTLVSFREHTFKIAEPEKALLDFLYFHPDMSTKNAIDGLRLGKDVFSERVDTEKLLKYATVFQNRSLSRRVAILLKTIC